jgi:hypothetical protein
MVNIDQKDFSIGGMKSMADTTQSEGYLCAGRPNGRSHRVGLEFSLFLSLFQDKERKEYLVSRQKEKEKKLFFFFDRVKKLFVKRKTAF